MNDPTPIEAPKEPAGGIRLPAVLGQRRTFLVNVRYQLRASLLIAIMVLVLLVIINYVLYATSAEKSAAFLANSPELERLVKGQDRVQLALVLVASLIFLGGVFVLSVLETHRTAGAAYNIEQRIEDLRSGRYGASVTLRRGDNLSELEQAFNALARTLREREMQDVDALERFAAEASQDPGGVAGRLRQLAAEKRDRIG